MNAPVSLFEAAHYAEAKALFEEAQEASLVALGSTHPGTLRVAGIRALVDCGRARGLLGSGFG